MATQAPAAAPGLDARLVEAREATGALLCGTTPGTGPASRLEFSQFTAISRREPHVPSTGSDLQVTTLAVCEPSRALTYLTIGPRT
jgi:hypothetical protein